MKTKKQTPRRKPKKQPAPKLPPESGPESTPRSRDEWMRAPLKKMIKGGKDAREATLLCMISRIVDESADHLDDPFFEERMSAEEKADCRSLQWNADEVVNEIMRMESSIGELSPTSWLYSPELANWWKPIRNNAWDLRACVNNITASVTEALKKKSRALGTPSTKKYLEADIEELPHRIKQAIDDNAELFLIVGFVLGLRTYRQKLQKNAEAMTLSALDEFTISAPRASDEERIDLASIHAREL